MIGELIYAMVAIYRTRIDYNNNSHMFLDF